MFEIEMLPAREGDCLWIRYGNPKAPKQILIDGGRAATAKEFKKRCQSLPPGQRNFELFIITHVDRDHIEGAMHILEDKTLGVTFKDVWFNGHAHLKDEKLETFGAVQGERVTNTLANRKLPWNKAWKRKAVCLRSTALPQIKLAGGMKLTLLSPDRKKLSDLLPLWERECAKAGIMPGKAARPSENKKLEQFGAVNIERLAESKFERDTGKPNGSSIAVLAEFEGKKALLTADAHVDRIVESIRKIKGGAKRLKVDVFKIAHHGSEGNISGELVKLVQARQFLVSTNGAYFQHPSQKGIARIIKFGGVKTTLAFNYQTQYNLLYRNPVWMQQFNYAVQFPAKGKNGTLTVEV